MPGQVPLSSRTENIWTMVPDVDYTCSGYVLQCGAARGTMCVHFALKRVNV